MYADDTTIYFNLEEFSINNRGTLISSELEKVTVWLRKNKLSLNAQKTKCMIFHTRQKKLPPISFSMDGKDVERVTFFKFLGIVLDEHLTMKFHTAMVTKNCQKSVEF